MIGFGAIYLVVLAAIPIIPFKYWGLTKSWISYVATPLMAFIGLQESAMVDGEVAAVCYLIMTLGFFLYRSRAGIVALLDGVLFASSVLVGYESALQTIYPGWSNIHATVFLQVYGFGWVTNLLVFRTATAALLVSMVSRGFLALIRRRRIVEIDPD